MFGATPADGGLRRNVCASWWRPSTLGLRDAIRALRRLAVLALFSQWLCVATAFVIAITYRSPAIAFDLVAVLRSGRAGRCPGFFLPFGRPLGVRSVLAYCPCEMRGHNFEGFHFEIPNYLVEHVFSGTKFASLNVLAT